MTGLVKAMRANLIWFIPLVLVALAIVFDNLLSSYLNVTLFAHRLSWSNCFHVALSPAAYIYFLSLGTAILLPFMVLVIPVFFGKDDEGIYSRRYFFSIALVIAVVIGGDMLEELIWGSVPLDAGEDSKVYVRYIPFIPWPEAQLFGSGQGLSPGSIHGLPAGH